MSLYLVTEFENWGRSLLFRANLDPVSESGWDVEIKLNSTQGGIREGKKNLPKIASEGKNSKNKVCERVWKCRDPFSFPLVWEIQNAVCSLRILSMVHSDEIKFKRMLIERPWSVHIFHGIYFYPESQNYHQSWWPDIPPGKGRADTREGESNTHRADIQNDPQRIKPFITSCIHLKAFFLNLHSITTHGIRRADLTCPCWF